MEKVHPYPMAVNRINKVVHFASPNGCWVCERNLPPQPCAVAVEGRTPYGLTDFIYLTCSQDCQRALKPELEKTGPNARSIPPAETCALLQAQEDVVGVIEGCQKMKRPYYVCRGPLFDHVEEALGEIVRTEPADENSKVN
jgi:hypothetical protein